MLVWLAEAHGQLRRSERRARIVHYWSSSGLLRAWDREYQVEAIEREAELFRGVARNRRGLDDAPDSDGEEDDPGGDGFLDEEDEMLDEWDSMDDDI